MTDNPDKQSSIHDSNDITPTRLDNVIDDQDLSLITRSHGVHFSQQVVFMSSQTKLNHHPIHQSSLKVKLNPNEIEERRRLIIYDSIPFDQFINDLDQQDETDDTSLDLYRQEKLRLVNIEYLDIDANKKEKIYMDIGVFSWADMD